MAKTVTNDNSLVPISIGSWLLGDRVAQKGLCAETGIMNAKIISLVFFLYLSGVSALYFHIAETERKCFIEEIPDETMVIGKSLVYP